jgi:hypothetical protein
MKNFIQLFSLICPKYFGRALALMDKPPLLLRPVEKPTKLPTFQKLFQSHGPVLVAVLRIGVVPNQITFFVHN